MVAYCSTERMRLKNGLFKNVKIQNYKIKRKADINILINISK